MTTCSGVPVVSFKLLSPGAELKNVFSAHEKQTNKIIIIIE